MTPQQQEDLERYNERRVEIAKAARLAKAHPTGDRPDIWDDVPKPTEERRGQSNVSPVGPATVEWKPLEGGTTVMIPGNVMRFIPDPASVPESVAEPKPQPRTIAAQPLSPVQGTRIGTSGIGAKTLPGAAAPCGPPGVPWVDPKKGRT